MWVIAVHLAVAGGGVFLCSFPTSILDEILDLTESFSEGFPTYLHFNSKFEPRDVKWRQNNRGSLQFDWTSALFRS